MNLKEDNIEITKITNLSTNKNYEAYSKNGDLFIPIPCDKIEERIFFLKIPHNVLIDAINKKI